MAISPPPFKYRTEKLRVACYPRTMTLSCPLDRPTVCRRRSYWLDQNQGTASYSTGWHMISETATFAWSLAFCTDSNRICAPPAYLLARSEEHTSELQSLMRNSYAVFCSKQKKNST